MIHKSYKYSKYHGKSEIQSYSYCHRHYCADFQWQFIFSYFPSFCKTLKENVNNYGMPGDQ